MSVRNDLNENVKYLFRDIRDYSIHWFKQIPYGIRAEIPCVSVIELLEFLAKSLMSDSIGGLTNTGISMLAGSAGAIGFVVPELHGENVLENKGERFDEKSVKGNIKQSFRAFGYGLADIALKGGSSRQDFVEHVKVAAMGESLAYLPASFTVHFFLEKYGLFGLLTLPVSIGVGGLGMAFPLAYGKFKEQKRLAGIQLPPKKWEDFYALAGDHGYRPQKRNGHKFSVQLEGDICYADRSSLLGNLRAYLPLPNQHSRIVNLYVPSLRRNDPRKEEYVQQINPLILEAEEELGAQRIVEKYALCGVRRPSTKE